MLSRLNHFFARLFYVDPRAYQIFLFLLGATSLWDVVSRFQEASPFYSSEGLLSDQYIAESIFNKLILPLNFLNRTAQFQQLLMLLQAIISLAIMAGYRSRLMCALLWVFLASRQVANPYVLSAGDEFLRHLIFWSCFLKAPSNSKNEINIGAVALGLQTISVYFFSAMMKTSPAWRTDGTAIGMAISLESFTYPFSRSLLAFPDTLKSLTVTTWYLELLVPLLFLLGAFSQKLRLLLALIMIGFHLTLFATFRLGSFPLISATGWLLWLPSEFWNTAKIKMTQFKAANTSKVLERLLTGLGIYLALFTLAINHRMSIEQPFNAGTFLNNVGDIFQLWQKWGMFAPMPSIDDGWNSFEGILTDGTRVSINGRGGPEDGTLFKNLGTNRPVDLGASYRSIGWRTFLYALHQSETNTKVIESYLDYLCLRTMKINPNLKLDSIDFFYNVEWTRANQTKAPAEKAFVINHYCQIR